MAVYVAALALRLVLGLFITEPVTMTLQTRLLKPRYFDHGHSRNDDGRQLTSYGCIWRRRLGAFARGMDSELNEFLLHF